MPLLHYEAVWLASGFHPNSPGKPTLIVAMPYPSPDKNDELLLPFLRACDAEEEHALVVLLEMARPVITKTLRRKSLLVGSQSDLADDLSSTVVLRLIEQLRKCKQSYEEDDDATVIRHFLALCQMITINVVNEHLRLKYPRRASLQNQLLYIIRETRDTSKQPLFALWRDLEERACGFRLWEGHRLVSTPAHRVLEDDPQHALHEALPGENAVQLPLHRVLSAMLRWLGSPAAFDLVVQATAHWRGIEDHADTSLSPVPEGEESVHFEPISPDLSPDERMLLKEDLRQLWQNIATLPPRQCAALLLNLSDAQGRGVLGFFAVSGIVTFAEIARVLNMETQEFSALWPKLPLEDREIAALYGCSASLVAMWRLRARARLKKNLKDM